MRAAASLSVALAAMSVGSAAAAQDALGAGGSGYTELADPQTIVEPFGITADELEDMDLHGPTGEQIGEVQEVLAGPDGAPAALVVETEEFLGHGGRKVVVDFERVEIVNRLVTSLDERELETLPEWNE